MGKSKEWVVDIKLANDKTMTIVYKTEKQGNDDLGLKKRQLSDMLRNGDKYKKASQVYTITTRGSTVY